MNCDKASPFVNLAPDAARFGTMVARNQRAHISLGGHARGLEGRADHEQRREKGFYASYPSEGRSGALTWPPMSVRLISLLQPTEEPPIVSKPYGHDRRFSHQGITSGERLLSWRQGDFHTTVLSPSLGSSIRGYRITFAEPLDHEILSGRGAVLYQVVYYRLSPPLRQSHVVGI